MAEEKTTCPDCGNDIVDGIHLGVCSGIAKVEPETPEVSKDPVGISGMPETIPDVKIEAPVKPKKEIATLANPFGFPKVTTFDKPYIDPTTHGQCIKCQANGVYTLADKLPYFRGRFLCPVCGPAGGPGYTYDLFEK